MSKSSCVTDFKYNKESKTLTILYYNTSGDSTYEYEGVPESVYTGLVQAESKGKYLNANVKGFYSYTKKG